VKLVRLVLLSLGHLITDVNQGAVVILIPVVKASFGLSIGAATALVTVSTVTSSVLQPLFGLLSDRFDLRWVIPGGILVAGLGMAFAGLAPSYPLVVLAVLLSGIGVAAFHPEASRWAGQAAGRRRATGMSYFSVGGNAGYALGVFAMAPLVVALGRGGMAWLLPPAAVVALLLAPAVAGFGRAPGHEEASLKGSLRAALSPVIGLLTAVVAVRSAVSIGFAALAPLYLHLGRGLPLTDAAWVTSAFLFAGALGTLLGGPLADRFGRRRQLLGSFVVQPVLGFVFVLVPGWPGYLALVLLGAAVVSSFAVTVVIAQEALPRHQGTASGIILGFAFGAGGISAGLLGALADAIGLQTSLLLLSALPVLGLGLIAALPETKKGERKGVPLQPVEL